MTRVAHRNKRSQATHDDQHGDESEHWQDHRILKGIERWPSAAAREHFQSEGIRLLEKNAIAPSAARLCSADAQPFKIWIEHQR
jgi:hypothetical protein